MNKIVCLFFVLAISSCSSSKIITLATQGELSDQEFNIEIPFYYSGKYIYVDVVINQKTYTFLFDTGWDVTHLDKSILEEIEFSPLKKYKTTGSSFEDGKVQYGVLSSLGIGQLFFHNIGVGIKDLSFVKTTFGDGRKIYGIIGANILRKATWQIDYNKQVIKLSNKIENFPPSQNAFQIPMIPKDVHGWGYNRIKLSINGVTDYFVFDTGSYGSFTANYSFLEQLKKSDVRLEEVKAKGEKRKFKLKEVKMNSLELNDRILTVEKGVSLLIGNHFLENYIVTIDWYRDQLFLEPVGK